MRERNEMFARAAAQHGVITTSQLVAAGVSRRAVERLLDEGAMRRVHRGVYLVGPVESPLAPAMAAVLTAGPGAVLSHHAAAGLWELLPRVEGVIDVTV